jgi:hypothetical protein
MFCRTWELLDRKGQGQMPNNTLADIEAGPNLAGRRSSTFLIGRPVNREFSEHACASRPLDFELFSERRMREGKSNSSSECIAARKKMIAGIVFNGRRSLPIARIIFRPRDQLDDTINRATSSWWRHHKCNQLRCADRSATCLSLEAAGLW